MLKFVCKVVEEWLCENESVCVRVNKSQGEKSHMGRCDVLWIFKAHFSMNQSFKFALHECNTICALVITLNSRFAL